MLCTAKTSAGGGGVFVTIKDDLTSLYEPILSISAELIWARLFIVGMKLLYICSFYRPPNSNLEPFLELKNFLSSLLNGKSVPPYLVLTGDFNLPDITWNETGGELAPNPTYGSLLNNTFLNILDDFSLEQLALSPTHENHIIDLVLTSLPGLFTNVIIVPGMSDHEAVTFWLNVAVKRLTKVKCKIFLFHKANIEGMKAKLQGFEKDFIESDPFG